MNTQEARDLAKRIAGLANAGRIGEGYGLLAPVLAQRTPFRLLDLIGEGVGAGPLEETNSFLEHVASETTEGGWVVIGSALGTQVPRDQRGAFARCRTYIIAADVWYGADILGDRVPGPALVSNFQPSLELLASWRQDGNRWVRRAVGVAVHFWGKRSRGAENLASNAEALLSFLEPMFEEWNMDAVKGVGWGLKTLGKHYPDLVADWLVEQLVQRQRRHRTLLLRKATAYLSEEQRARATAGAL